MAVDRGFDATLSLSGGSPGMLAGSADRERTIDVLKAGFAEGRLTRAEFGDRIARVQAARTYGELGALIADLPAGPLGGPASSPNVGFPPQQLARPATNSMAVAALTCGIAEFFTMGLTAIPAIVLGHAARRQVRRTGQGGDGMALAGLILGWTGIVLIAAAIAGLVIIAAHSAHPVVVHDDPLIVIKPVPAGPPVKVG
jgi:Domain of unknown function (DUF4190)/Domain of unknown function (DUF1707)